MAAYQNAHKRIHSIPTTRIVSIEHPGIIRNLDRGIKSLGGEAQLKHVLEHHVGDSKLTKKENQLPEPVAGVSLRPDDPLAKKIASVGAECRNVLVKVTLPKRTGRKRKRGSDEPFTEAASQPDNTSSIKAQDLLGRIRDNQAKYSIEPISLVRETHRFRTLPDFQIRNSDMPVMRTLRDHAFTPDYAKLKDFSIDHTSGPPHVDSYPGPPYFTSIDMPYKYEYQQAAAVVYVQDESGQVTSRNLAAATKRLTWSLAPDVEEIPMEAPISIPRKSPNGEVLPRAIEELKKLLEQRPVVTKRVALNSMTPMSDTIFKEATQFVGYSFKAGPWRDSLIKYGVDPRKDPEMRKYQTLMFQIDKEAFKAPAGAEQSSKLWSRPMRHTRDDPKSHIFDGKSVTANGKTWQVCDVLDPMVKAIYDTQNLPAKCDVYTWGWYHNGTMAKARTIMKDKIRHLFAKQEPPEEAYQKIIDLIPDRLTKENCHSQAVLSHHVHGQRANQLAMEIRTIVKSGDFVRQPKSGWAPQERVSHEKQKEQSGIDGVDEMDAAVADDDDEDEDVIDPELRELDATMDDGEGDFQDMDAEIEAGAQYGDDGTNNLEEEGNALNEVD